MKLDRVINRLLLAMAALALVVFTSVTGQVLLALPIGVLMIVGYAWTRSGMGEAIGPVEPVEPGDGHAAASPTPRPDDAVVSLRRAGVEPPTAGAPEVVINLVSLLMVIWLVRTLWLNPSDAPTTMMQFGVLMTAILLFARRSTRIDGQIMMLSLIIIVATLVLSFRLMDGVLISLLSVLLFLAVLLAELRGAQQRATRYAGRYGPAGAVRDARAARTGRGGRGDFLTTALVLGLFVLTLSVVIAAITPRTNLGRVANPIDEMMQALQTGTSPTISLEGLSPGAGSQKQVLIVSVKSDNPITPEGIRLRGGVLDTYDRYTRTWRRSYPAAASDRQVRLPHPDGAIELVDDPLEQNVTVYEITLPDRNKVRLHTVYPYTWLQSTKIDEVILNTIDLQLSLPGFSTEPITYRVAVPPSVPTGFQAAAGDRIVELSRRSSLVSMLGRAPRGRPDYARGWALETRRVRELALSVLADRGLTRDPDASYTDDDPKIIAALEAYIRNEFQYTRANPMLERDVDPLVAFLFDHRSGHCELFAAGLVAMARSVGIRGRLVSGYLATEYNTMGGFYVVREDDAHAWAELEIAPDVWIPVDPTPPTEVAAEHQPQRTWWSRIRDLWSLVEFIWLQIFHGDEPPDEAEPALADGQRPLAFIRPGQLLQFWNQYQFVIMFLLLAATVAAFGAWRVMLALFGRDSALRRAWAAWRRRGDKTAATRTRFYDEMIATLAEQGFRREPGQSPMQFATELARQNPFRYGPVLSLTRHYYELRYGDRAMTEARQADIDQHLEELRANLRTMQPQNASPAA